MLNLIIVMGHFLLMTLFVISAIVSLIYYFSDFNNVALYVLLASIFLFVGFVFIDPLKSTETIVEGSKINIYAAQDYTNGIEAGRYTAKNNDFVYYIYSKNQGKAVGKYDLADVTFFNSAQGSKPYIQFFNQEEVYTYFGFTFSNKTYFGVKADFYVPENTLEEKFDIDLN